MTSLEDKENAPGNVIVIDDTPAERQEDVRKFPIWFVCDLSMDKFLIVFTVA